MSRCTGLDIGEMATGGEADRPIVLDVGEMATEGEADGPIALDVDEMGREGEADPLGWQAPSP